MDISTFCLNLLSLCFERAVYISEIEVSAIEKIYYILQRDLSLSLSIAALLESPAKLGGIYTEKKKPQSCAIFSARKHR